MMDAKDIENFELLNEILSFSKNINSFQKNNYRVILENYDLSLFEYKLDKKIAEFKKALME